MRIHLSLRDNGRDRLIAICDGTLLAVNELIMTRPGDPTVGQDLIVDDFARGVLPSGPVVAELRLPPDSPPAALQEWEAFGRYLRCGVAGTSAPKAGRLSAATARSSGGQTYYLLPPKEGAAVWQIIVHNMGINTASGPSSSATALAGQKRPRPENMNGSASAAGASGGSASAAAWRAPAKADCWDPLLALVARGLLSPGASEPPADAAVKALAAVLGPQPPRSLLPPVSKAISIAHAAPATVLRPIPWLEEGTDEKLPRTPLCVAAQVQLVVVILLSWSASLWCFAANSESRTGAGVD
jgi:hypothetical protein